MVHQHDGQHGLGDGGGADAHAGVVAAMGGDHRGCARLVDRTAFQADAGGRLDRHADQDVLPGGDAADHATGVVGEEAIGTQFVAMLAAALGDAGKAGADLHTLHRIDAHHGVGDVGVQPVIHRLAPTHRHTAGHHVDARADGVARLAQLVHVGFQLRHDAGIGHEEGAVELVPGDEGNLDRAELGHPAADDDAVALLQPLARDGAGGDAYRGLARRRAPAATMVADAVFLPVGVVGVPRAEGLGDVAVVLAALILVADQQRDRGAGSTAFEHPGKDLHLVRLAALGDMARGTRLAQIEFGLDVGSAERQPRGTAIDHAADGRAVGFAERRDGEQRA